MNCRPRHRRPACLLLSLWSLTLVGTSGCQLNRSFFQMDSNSRVPFFAVDLAPKWPKRTSSVDGVSRLQSESDAGDADDVPKTPNAASDRRLTVPATQGAVAGSVDPAPVEVFR